MDGRGDLAARLAEGWLGSNLPPSVRDRLAELAVLRHFDPPVEIDREGEETKEFGLVSRGRIALRTFVPGRGWVTTLTVEPGDLFGWSALVPPHRASATAVVVEPVDAIVFDAERLRAALRADDTLAATLYPLVLHAIARRLAATRFQLLDLFAARELQPW